MNAYTIETASGALVDLRNPDPATIRTTDLTTHLGRAPRFTGAIGDGILIYSVAQHSVWCLNAALRRAPGLSCQDQLYVLLHDAHEAYTGDLSSPQKAALGQAIREIQASLQDAIHAHLGLPLHPSPDTQRLIFEVDYAALYLEALVYLPSHAKTWLGPTRRPADFPAIDSPRPEHYMARFDGSLRSLLSQGPRS